MKCRECPFHETDCTNNDEIVCQLADAGAEFDEITMVMVIPKKNLNENIKKLRNDEIFIKE
jgi:hypothetical protein